MVGLYMVLWGKSKDQNQQYQESSIDQQHKDGMKTEILKHINVEECCNKTSSDLESV